MSDRPQHAPQSAALIPTETCPQTKRSWAAAPLVLACAVIGVGTHGSTMLRAQTPSEPVRVGGDISPTAAKGVRAVYPADALQAQVEGSVVIEATIDRSGKVYDGKVLQSVRLLDHADLNAVRQWEFTPTLINRVPVAVIMPVTANFTIRRLREDQVIALLGPSSLQQSNPNGSVTWYYDGTSVGTLRVEFSDGHVVSVPAPRMRDELHRQAAATNHASPLPSALNASVVEAVKAGDVQKTKRLLASGADANSRDDQGNTLLVWPAISGSKEMAELLIAHGALVSATNRSGFTPLFTAAYHSRRDIAELLIASGADVNAKSTAGWTPLHKAMERLANPEVTPQQPSSSDVAEMISVVELLLVKGADVKAAAASGDTPLHFAAGAGSTALIEQLLAKGADINAKGFEDVTPLYAAVKRDRVQTAEMLIARGAAINMRTKGGLTPLIFASYEGDTEMVQLLLGHGSDVDARDHNGTTSLMWALRTASSLSPSAQKVLLSNLSAAEQEQFRRDLQNLKGQWRDVAKLLVDHGANVHTDASAGASPLFLASNWGDLTVVEALIAKGADVNSAGSESESPLHAAIAEQHQDVAELLINKGANVNARNASERTPLHFLAVFLDDAHLAALLIARGADVGARDTHGATPLSYAIRAGHTQVADVLRHPDRK